MKSRTELTNAALEISVLSADKVKFQLEFSRSYSGHQAVFLSRQDLQQMYIMLGAAIQEITDLNSQNSTM